MAKVFQCDRCHEITVQHGFVRVSDEHTANITKEWELCRGCYRTIADELATIPDKAVTP